MGGKRRKITNNMTAPYSSATAANRSSVADAAPVAATNRFRSPFHEARFTSKILFKNYIPEKFFDLKNAEFPEIQHNLTRRNWVHFPEVIKPVPWHIVREFYANAYFREGEKKMLTSVVRGKVVRYDWQTIDRVLQINYQGGCNVSSRRRIKQINYLDVDYDELLNFLCRPGSAWMDDKIPNINLTLGCLGSANAPKWIRSEDLKPVAKAWSGFFLHTIEPHCFNSTYLTDNVAMGIVAIMKDEEVNISKLISRDIFIMVHHGNTVFGHASLIVRLCEEAGVEDVSGGALLNPREPINFRCIQSFVLHEEAFQHWAEAQAQAQQPQPQPHQPQAQLFRPHDFGDETTVEHRFQMASFCWMQDVSVRLGIPATYLTNQTDICAAAQRFRERYSFLGPSPPPP